MIPLMAGSLDMIARLPLSGVDAVIFYKRDEITTDLICCDVEAGGQIWTFHEAARGWDALIAHLSGLPGFNADWYGSVVNPPFAINQTVAYRRA